MHYTYILECSDGSYYCGYSTDPVRRENEHNKSDKAARYTRARRPVRLVYTESYETKSEAMHREWEIKHMTRTEKEKLVNCPASVTDAELRQQKNKGE